MGDEELDELKKLNKKHNESTTSLKDGKKKDLEDMRK